MAGTITLKTRSRSAASSVAQRTTLEAPWVRWTLTALAIVFLLLFLFMPLAVVFVSAFGKGISAYFASFREPDALAAIRLTLMVAGIAVPLNLVFGVAAAWAVAKFEFAGKSLLITLIDLPFSVSPVVSGLVYVLLFGAQGLLGPLLEKYNLH